MSAEPAVGVCRVKKVELTPGQISHRGSHWVNSSRLRRPGNEDERGAQHRSRKHGGGVSGRCHQLVYDALSQQGRL